MSDLLLLVPVILLVAIVPVVLVALLIMWRPKR